MKSVSCSPPARSNSCRPNSCVASHPSGKPESLSAEVKAYCSAGRKRLVDSLEWFGKASSLEESIQRAALSVMCDGKIHPHQRRVGAEALVLASEHLRLGARDIKSAPSFQCIMSTVAEVAGPVRRIGKLAIYDIALRIGWFRGPKFKPERVYLHAGASDGAKALNIRMAREVPITSFPPGLQRLKPYEIEDFLCVHKDCLAELPKAQELVA